jgi:hypothetical protein
MKLFVVEPPHGVATDDLRFRGHLSWAKLPPSFEV